MDLLQPGTDLLRFEPFAREHVSDLVFVTVSGAHLYGFPSPDSDVDLRGAFLAPLSSLVSLSRPVETLEPKGYVDGLEVEMVAHDLGKYLRLLIKPSGYVLEQIFSPWVVITSPDHEELKSLALASLSRRLIRHYRGFALSEWRAYQKSDAEKTVKRLLYLFRVLMTGIVVLSEGVVEADLARLNERFHLDLAPLIEAKVREHVLMTADDGRFVREIEQLFVQLDEAAERSPLPENIPNRDAIEEFLVRLRLRHVSLIQ
ncbi:nucleotidyltransferase [Capsulimonas corticalis]|uniref:Nucleotidyltransferase n=1 Tax=Capsulimonas corticalis TaxID=2219043 RepID=A0A402CPL8_9BACT|nr:nucleotidyltransferase domain-containing protein [Capsulimonas corticalis]BDI33023.1 nucleotidyltransferase [Capsulimonas corticalis]